MSARAKFVRYGFLGSVRLVKNMVLTRIFYPHARLIRFPFFVRGHRGISWGRGLTTGINVRFDAESDGRRPVLILGDRIQVNDSVHVAAIDRVEIGDDTLIASRVFISDHNHGRYDGPDPLSTPDVPPELRPISSAPVVIGRKVWIGEGVAVLPGITIGDGAIVGAGAVVTRDIPPRSIAVGNPARVVRVYDDASGEWRRV